MKRRYVRTGDELSDDTVVVVRGGDLDVELITADATRAHEVYGVYAVSVLAARDCAVDELAQQPPLVRFARLTLMTVGTLRDAGFALEATGRNPRHFSVRFDDLDPDVTRFCGCEHRSLVNPYHEP